MYTLIPHLETAVKAKEIFGTPSFIDVEKDMYLRPGASGDSTFVAQASIWTCGTFSPAQRSSAL